eukprot:CAMPEP_0172639792 /NCGR_PEP_ID=MMETSP1068-20121228/219924_1 /TAXON_ID=35684 /ORGANISM="Pseudopedinella elastica, Strain CCMP716" /LENGTH=171 /DNA_ID=CAMNT_0013453023 /DNA_START=59 /DNA_END=571 /DNA_ORIENTATION=+
MKSRRRPRPVLPALDAPLSSSGARPELNPPPAAAAPGPASANRPPRHGSAPPLTIPGLAPRPLSSAAEEEFLRRALGPRSSPLLGSPPLGSPAFPAAGQKKAFSPNSKRRREVQAVPREDPRAPPLGGVAKRRPKKLEQKKRSLDRLPPAVAAAGIAALEHLADPAAAPAA